MNSPVYVNVSVLRPHPRNEELFDEIDGEEYERFKKSIDEDGLLTPLIVTRNMTVISGHQRLRACRDLGIQNVPVIIDESSDEDEEVKKLIAANFGRSKNDPIKQARLIKEYERLSGVRQGSAGKGSLERHNVARTQAEIAAELGVSVRTLQRLKSLDTLAPELQELISEGVLTPTIAHSLLTRLTLDEQQELVSRLTPRNYITNEMVKSASEAILGERGEEIEGITEEDALEHSHKQAEMLYNQVDMARNALYAYSFSPSLLVDFPPKMKNKISEDLQNLIMAADHVLKELAKEGKYTDEDYIDAEYAARR